MVLNLGSVKLAYYLAVIALAILINGSAGAAILAAFVAWYFEPAFTQIVTTRFGAKAAPAKKAAAKTGSKGGAKKAAKGKAG